MGPNLSPLRFLCSYAPTCVRACVRGSRGENRENRRQKRLPEQAPIRPTACAFSFNFSIRPERQTEREREGSRFAWPSAKSSFAFCHGDVSFDGISRASRTHARTASRHTWPFRQRVDALDIVAFNLALPRSLSRRGRWSRAISGRILGRGS